MDKLKHTKSIFKFERWIFVDVISREAMFNEINSSLEEIFAKYNLDDIAIFEEEDIDNGYTVGYTIKKDDEIHKILLPITKNENGELTRLNDNFIVESNNRNSKGYESLEDVLNYLELGF